MRATSFLRTKQLISDDFPTLERPKMAISGRSSLGQSRARALLLTNSTCLIWEWPAKGPITMLEPGSTISSVNSSISTPGGMNRTERANLASSEMERVVGREQDVIRGVEMRFGVRKNRVVCRSLCDWKCEGRKGARFIVKNRHRSITIFFGVAEMFGDRVFEF